MFLVYGVLMFLGCIAAVWLFGTLMAYVLDCFVPFDPDWKNDAQDR